MMPPTTTVFFQTEILEETIRYIDSLHEQLVATIRSKGLPTSLRQSLEAHKGKIIIYLLRTLY